VRRSIDLARLGARAIALRAALPLLVSRTTLPELLESLGARPDARGGLGDSQARLRVLDRLLRPLRFWRTTCLYRALGGYALLRSAGEDVRFLIGVRVVRGGDVEAHAWLERDGKPSLGAPGPEEGFSVAYAYPVENARGAQSGKGERMGTLRPSDDVILTEMQDGTGVLLHLETKYYYTLNRTGVRVWKLLATDGAEDEQAVANALATEFGSQDRARVREDVAALVRELVAEKLLLSAQRPTAEEPPVT
jgi:hypothetical protein